MYEGHIGSILIQHPAHLHILSVMLKIALLTVHWPVWVLLINLREHLLPNIRVGYSFYTLYISLIQYMENWVQKGQECSYSGIS